MKEDVSALEHILIDSWPAQMRATMDGWTLQADRGAGGRPNAAAPLAWTGDTIDDTLARAGAWYADRGLPLQIRIADSAAAPAGLAAMLADRGFAAAHETRCMTAPLHTARAHLAGAPDGVTLSPGMPPAINAVLRETAAGAADFEERRGIAARTPEPRAFALMLRDGAPAATGLCVVVRGCASIFMMRTHPAHRRHGLARAVLASLLRWADGQGATFTGLQVEADNASAIALYAACGYTDAYRYRYWRRDRNP